jgi:hypothetical protein
VLGGYYEQRCIFLSRLFFFLGKLKKGFCQTPWSLHYKRFFGRLNTISLSKLRHSVLTGTSGRIYPGLAFKAKHA